MIGAGFVIHHVPVDEEAIPVNTVAPVINTSATIGVQIAGSTGTWTNSPTSYEYKWQRVTSDIVGATSINYTPVDASWGYTLRLAVRARNGAGFSSWVYSNNTNRVVDIPVQSYSLNRFTNGGFDDGSVWNVGANWSIGTGVATGANTSTLLFQAVTGSAADWVESTTDTVVTSGQVRQRIGAAFGAVMTATGSYISLMRRPDANANDGFAGFSFSGSVDNAVERLITKNGQLVSPLANKRVPFYYTLPGSPTIGTTIHIFTRISDFALGNYWRTTLIWGTQWDINLYSVASGVATSRIAAANIGVTNGIAVEANADAWKLETTANSGGSWTSRGTTTNSAYQTSTDVNVLFTSNVTPLTLEYVPV